MQHMLEITGLKKTYGRPGFIVPAIEQVDLAVQAGQLLTLLGPSGCGKTTTLRCIAGLVRPDAGRIVIGGRVVVDVARGIFVPASERGIGMVFQSYAIWPHMSVFENVAFPLRVCRDRKYREPEIRELVGRALDMVRLSGTETRHATQLSGGQQQRVAFARAIVHTPSLLLLDEPLSNLDARLRDEMRVELKRLQASLGLTTIYVTHDQAEALDLSDQVALFQTGRIAQLAAPAEIYRQPASRYVADFIGAANFLPGIVEAAGNPISVRTSHGTVRCVAAAALAAGEAVTLSIRPETIRLSPNPPQNGENALAGIVTGRSFFGDVLEYGFDLGGHALRVRAAPHLEFATGQNLFAVFTPTDCLALTT